MMFAVCRKRQFSISINNSKNGGWGQLGLNCSALEG